MSRSLIPKRRTDGVEADFPRYMSEIFGIHVAAIDANLVYTVSLGIPETPTGPVRLGESDRITLPLRKLTHGGDDMCIGEKSYMQPQLSQKLKEMSRSPQTYFFTSPALCLLMVTSSGL